MSNKFYQRESKGFIYNSQIEPSIINEIISVSQNMNTQELQNAMTRLNTPINLSDNFGNNLIHHTLLNQSSEKNEQNRLNFIKFLINNNVNPDSPNQDNNTPLHLAAKFQFEEIIKYLLKLGVNPNFKDSLGNTAFHYYLNGLISKFKSKIVYNLVEPSENKFNGESLSDEQMNNLRDIINRLKTDLFKKEGVKSVENTIKNSLFFNYPAKNTISEFNNRDFGDNTKSLTDKILPYFNRLVTNIMNSWDNFNITNDISNLKSKKDISLEIAGIINNSSNDITKLIDGLGEEISISIDINEKVIEFPKKLKRKDSINSLNKFRENVKASENYMNENIAPNCINAGSNFIDLETNTFIGGHKVLDIKKIDLDTNDELSNFFKEETDKFINLFTNKIFETTNLGVKDDIIDRLFNQSNKKSSFIDFYDNFISMSGNNQFEITNLMMYYFAGYINSDTANYKLSMTQGFKPLIANKIANKTATSLDKLSLWVYCLLSNQNFSELSELINRDFQSQFTASNFTDTEAFNISNFLRKINDETIDIDLELDKAFIDRYDEIVYAITIKYQKMIQKPILNHVIDTIFIIRKYKLEESLDVDTYLNGFTLSLDKDISLKNIVNDIVPSKKYLGLKFNDFDQDIQKKNDKIRDLESSPNVNAYISKQIADKRVEIANINEEKEEIESKFFEAQYLGLTYLTCFPGNRYYNEFFDIDVDNNNSLSYDYKFLPYMNFISSNNPEFVEEKFKNVPFFGYFFVKKDFNIGPSSKDALNKAFVLLSQSIGMLFNNNMITDIDKINKLYISEVNKFDGEILSGNFFKTFPELYIEMLTLNQMNMEIINQFEKISLNKFSFINYEKFINSMVKEINKINAYFFINYYIFQSNLTKLPSFYYYQFPKVNTQEKSLIFNKDRKSKILSEDMPIKKLDEEKFDDERYKEDRVSGVLSLYSSIYPMSGKFNESFINSIIKGQKFITLDRIDKFMLLSKEAVIPPSLLEYFSQFYDYMVANIIIDLESDFKDEIENLILIKVPEEKKSSVINKYFVKIVENVLSSKFSELVKEISWNILDTNKEADQNLKSRYISDIKPIENFDFPTFANENKFEGFYRTNEIPKKESNFILVPNDYTVNELTRNLNVFKIKDSILKLMLENNCKPFIVNKNNEGPIISCLRNYYYVIFKALKDNTLKFQQFYENGLIYGVQLPLNFMLNELKNHLKKLVFDETNIKNILEKFSYNQYQEVKLIILNNEAFGNNILRNLDLSYSVVGYIINQYFFKNLFKSSEYEKLIDFLNKAEITKDKVLSSPFFNFNSNIRNSNYYYFLDEIKNNLEEKNKKLNEEIKTYGDNITSIEANFGTSAAEIYQEKIIVLNKEMRNNKTKLTNIENAKIDGIPNMNSFDAYKINSNFINDLDNFLNLNQNKRGPYMEFWKKYLENSELDSEDYNLLMLKICSDLSNELTKFTNIDENTSKGDFNFLDDKSFIFEHTEKIALEYFESPKYIENNPLLKYIKQILKHLTQNVICFDFEITMKKVFYEHFESVESVDILNDVELIFSSIKSIREDGKDMIDILYNEVAEDLVMNISNPIFKNRKEEINFTSQSAYETFSNYVNLLQLGPLKVTLDSNLRKNFENVIKYYSEISPKIIYNWFVTIENYLKFVINQSRIIKSFNNLSN